MKTTFRKSIVTLLVLVLALALCPGLGFADEGATSSTRYKITKNITSGSEYGTITIIDSDDGTKATLYPKEGETVTFRVSVKRGYTATGIFLQGDLGWINNWYYTNIPKAGINKTFSFEMPAENVTIYAKFVINNRSITKAGTFGTNSFIIVDGADGTKASIKPQVGTTVTIKAKSNTATTKLIKMNYVAASTGKPMALTKVIGTSSTYTFVMPNDNVTVNAEYRTSS